MFIKKSLQLLRNSKNINILKDIQLSQKFIQPFSLKEQQAKIPVPPKIQYPTTEQYFPEGLESHQKEVPRMDPEIMNKVFSIDHMKPVDQRAAYFQVNKQGKILHVFDASKMPLGRMCQRISLIIRGKNKPTYKPNSGDCGDNCVIINAGDILMTGRKALKKKIIYHTGYVGHLRTIKYSEYLLHKPEQLIIYVISKQLPKNLLRRGLLKKVDIFRGAEHNMLNKFPNFLPSKPKYDFLKSQSPMAQALSKNTVITYSSSEEIPEEFKHLKHEQDSSIEIPFEDRDKVFKMTKHNREVIKQWKKYFNQEKRYKIYKPKQPKSRRPDVDKDDIFLRSETQAKRLGLSKYMNEDDVNEIEDQTSKVKFFE